ncbi:phosphatase [Oscillospiraceae bacterium MB08-C2-2]|nr:phosphatase [Oscillospiraceae bacterium MB08-C2-2]
MKIIADTHTHTSACSHGYSTLWENIQHARKIGLKFLAYTEHGPSLEGSPNDMYFRNFSMVPDCVDDIVILKGAEVNILDFDGALDLSDKILAKLDWVIASFHTMCIEPGTREDHTRAWLSIARNPLVDVIGHCGDERYCFDHEVVIKEFAQYNKIVEVNAHSFDCRPGSETNCPAIMDLCQKYNVPVVVSSDAHFFTHIGEFDKALEVLKSIDFPQELVLNADYNRFLEVARRITGKKLVD